MSANILCSVSTSIDTLLDKKWTEKEILFYEMLLSKISKYKHLYKVPTVHTDSDNIIKNIREQPLFAKCKHPDLLCSIVSGLRVVSLKETPDHYDLNIKLNAPAHFIVEYSKKHGDVRYRVSFRNEADTEHGYVAYMSSTSKARHLPEYEKISKVLPDLDRVEIIHLATELLTYYDANDIISNLDIGVKYPVSLITLSRQASEV